MSHKATIISDRTINNPSGATIKSEFKYSDTTTDSYEWHLTGGVTTTVGVETSVWLPLVGESKATASVELKVEGGKSTTKSRTEHWEDTETIEVPPNTGVYLTAELRVGSVKGTPFRAQLRAIGSVGTHCQSGTDVFFWQYADFDGYWRGMGLGPVKRHPLDDADRNFGVTGTFDGTVGLKVIVNAKPLKIEADSPVHA